MLPHFHVIGGNSIPHPFRPMLLFCFYCILWVCHVSIRDRHCEDTLLLLCVVDTCCSSKVETFEKSKVQEHVAKSTPISVSIVFVAFQTTERIFTVCIPSCKVSELPFCVIHWERRVELKDILKESTWRAHLRSAVKCKMFSNGQRVINEFIVAIYSSRKSLEIRIFYNAEILIVSKRHIA